MLISKITFTSMLRLKFEVGQWKNERNLPLVREVHAKDIKFCAGDPKFVYSLRVDGIPELSLIYLRRG